ncbi:MAG: hypothetical protein KJ072_28470 [Verrucomicrobia bacterium]|nr:hypothetical protein [Verrucomicrobiota bacterium]
MNLLLLAGTTACLLLPQMARAEIALGTNVTFAFASIETGRQILTRRDDFVQRLSPFDRAARLKTDREISEGQFLDFVGTNVLAWTEGEKQKLTEAIQELQTPLASLALRLPKTVYLVKTTGHEEGHAAYIIHPEEILADNFARLVLQQRQGPSPEVIDRIERVLIDSGAPGPNPYRRTRRRRSTLSSRSRHTISRRRSSRVASRSR